MIYQIFGFNMVCDSYIKALENYHYNVCDEELPSVLVQEVDELVNSVTDPIILSGEYANMYFSDDKCFFELIDGTKIEITSKELLISGQFVNAKRIGEEFEGPSIIALSRFHKRAVLHGSAFVYHGKAYLVLAYPGAGKSTLSAAMAMYQNEVLFVTDDVICVTKDGRSIFNGVHSVDLNDDSMSELIMSCDDCAKTILRLDIESAKTTCNMEPDNRRLETNIIPVGGIIILDDPIVEGEIKVQKLSMMQSFCEITKNIKMRKTMTKEMLVHEMNVINKMVNQGDFVIKLQIEHDYSKLQKITNRLRELIDEYGEDRSN